MQLLSASPSPHTLPHPEHCPCPRAPVPVAAALTLPTTLGAMLFLCLRDRVKEEKPRTSGLSKSNSMCCCADGQVHLGALRELADGAARPLSVLLEKSQPSSEALGNGEVKLHLPKINLRCYVLFPCVDEQCVQSQTEYLDLTEANALIPGRWVLDKILYYFQLAP